MPRKASRPALVLGILLLAFVAAIGVGAPWIATIDPRHLDPQMRLLGPSPAHPFGTDGLGRDVFSRVVWGCRISLVVAAAVTALACAAGTLLGLACAFMRWADGPISRAMDGLMSVPAILLAAALTAVTRAGLATVILAIAVTEIPRVARLVRSLALTLREQLFVEAAHAVGAGLPAILWRHVLPNMTAPLMVQATFTAASAVLAEAALSFLGVGVPVQMPSLGGMMADGRDVAAVALHVVLYPGIVLAAMVLAINMVGDGLSDALDPRRAATL